MKSLRVCPPNEYLEDGGTQRITYCDTRADCDHEWPELDEVVLRDVTVHVERMDDGHIWIGIDCADGRQLAVNLFTNPRGRARIYGRAEWDL